MAISIGDRMPQLTLKTLRDGLPQDIGTDAVFDGKTVVLFAVPGAFTPGCSQTHLPGYVVHADDIKARGVDTIACVSVNDAFVMGAWGKAQNAEALLMLADADATLVKALGLELDASGFGLGLRSKRYSMVVKDGVVTHLSVEPDGAGIQESTAERMLEQLA